MLRSNLPTNQVAIISGGGSGHEPAHAGFVGKGALTGAVCGEVFASPTAEAVLAAIRAVATPAGVLLILKNYTGDRLHFGLAAEQARAEGIRVETVVVADDVALRSRQPRGLAGTVLVQKIAGALAEAGHDLDTVAAAARSAAADTVTLGIALSPATLPGSTPPAWQAGKWQLGLGIHGEPGAASVDPMPLQDLMTQMLDIIQNAQRRAPSPASSVSGRSSGDPAGPMAALAAATQHMSGAPEEGDDSAVLLVNGLGGLSNLELAATAKAAHTACIEAGVLPVRVYTGEFMTALNMKGVSISMLPVSEARLNALDAVSEAPGWAPAAIAAGHLPDFEQGSTPLPAKSRRSAAGVDTFGALMGGPKHKLSALTGQAQADWHKLLVRAAVVCNALNDASARVGEADSLAGDGDCGNTVAATAGALGALITVAARAVGCTHDAVRALPTDSTPAAVMEWVAQEVAPMLLQHATPAHFLMAAQAVVARAAGGTLGGLTAAGLQSAANWMAAVQSGAVSDADMGEALARLVAHPSETVPALTAGYAAEHDGGSTGTLAAWAGAAVALCCAVMQYGGAALGDRTCVDALLPACLALVRCVHADSADTLARTHGAVPAAQAVEATVEPGHSVTDALNQAAAAAVAGSAQTEHMRARVGRAAHIAGESLGSAPDAGALVVATVFAALRDSITE